MGKQWGPLGRSPEQACSEAHEQSMAEKQKTSAAVEEGTGERGYRPSMRVPDCRAKKHVFNPAGVKSNKV